MTAGRGHRRPSLPFPSPGTDANAATIHCAVLRGNTAIFTGDATAVIAAAKAVGATWMRTVADRQSVAVPADWVDEVATRLSYGMGHTVKVGPVELEADSWALTDWWTPENFEAEVQYWCDVYTEKHRNEQRRARRRTA